MNDEALITQPSATAATGVKAVGLVTGEPAASVGRATVGGVESATGLVVGGVVVGAIVMAAVVAIVRARRGGAVLRVSRRGGPARDRLFARVARAMRLTPAEAGVVECVARGGVSPTALLFCEPLMRDAVRAARKTSLTDSQVRALAGVVSKLGLATESAAVPGPRSAPAARGTRNAPPRATGRGRK